jgi:hypothetical protein
MIFYALVMPSEEVGNATWWFDSREEAEVLLPNLMQLVPDARIEKIDVPTKSKLEMADFLNQYALRSRPSAEKALREAGALKDYHS